MSREKGVGDDGEVGVEGEGGVGGVGDGDSDEVPGKIGTGEEDKEQLAGLTACVRGKDEDGDCTVECFDAALRRCPTTSSLPDLMPSNKA